VNLPSIPCACIRVQPRAQPVMVSWSLVGCTAASQLLGGSGRSRAVLCSSFTNLARINPGTVCPFSLNPDHVSLKLRTDVAIAGSGHDVVAEALLADIFGKHAPGECP